MVVSEEEWIPAQNTVGRQLWTAHKYFAGGELSTARDHLLAAIRALRSMPDVEHGPESTQLDRELEAAAEQLEELATKLGRANEVSRAELDRSLVAAHRADLHWEWSQRGDDGRTPWLERPRDHFRRAKSMLQVHADASAAVGVRRGVAYLRLLAQYAPVEDRPQLDAQVEQLNRLAHDADRGDLTLDELRAGLTRAEAVFATAYLRTAVARYEAKQREEAGRALRTAAAHMSARLEWLGAQADVTSSELVREVDRAGVALGKGARPSEHRLLELVGRATRTL